MTECAMQHQPGKDWVRRSWGAKQRGIGVWSMIGLIQKSEIIQLDWMALHNGVTRGARGRSAKHACGRLVCQIRADLGEIYRALIRIEI